MSFFIYFLNFAACVFSRPPASSGCAASKTETASRAVESSFKTLLGKVDKHSDFEDTQLFRFFKENVPEVGDQMR